MFNIKEFATHDEYVVYTANTGDFITPNVSYCRKKRECHFTSKQPQRDYTHDYLTFIALEDGTFKLSGNSINYSLDSGQTWVSLASNTNTPTVSAGNTIMWKMSGKSTIGRFSSSAKFAVQGNAMSIVSGDSFDGASAISDYQFRYLFSGCTGLVGAKNLYLPTTTLAIGCYYGMFSSCTSLISTPTLPATTLVLNCYYSMFSGCTSLTTSPVLPATNLESYCYAYMFAGCTSFKTAPELPATTLSDSCYYYMFSGCTSLTTAPELPATKLAEFCYSNMFVGCRLLTIAPVLPATTLAGGCYNGMFNGCSSLNYIKALFTTTPGNSYTTYWVSGVAPTGTFVKNAAATWNVSGSYGVPYGWYVESEKTPIVPTTSFTTNNYITLESQQSDSIISIKNSSNQTFYISEDHQNWAEITGGFAYPLSGGETIYICGVLNGDNTTSDYSNIAINGKVALIGSCNSLWNYEDPTSSLRPYCGYGLFSGSTGLLNAPELPATTLASYCYYSMFYNCSGLTTAPELPATTLANGCYNGMFQNCIGLTTAPSLPATTLTPSCYGGMFINCTSLTTAPALPVTTLADSCYNAMFSGCRSLTTIPSVLPATVLAYHCYDGMFANCTSLTTAPELPATGLAGSCYVSMFQNCTSLTSAPALPATRLANECYRSMFAGCTSLTTAPTVLPAATLIEECYYHMFSNCTSLTAAPQICATTMAASACTYMFQECGSLTTAPELPATTLADSCYEMMFRDCTSLTTAPALPATTLATYCYCGMFEGCRSLTTSPELPATTLANNCYYYMFYNCTSLTIAPELPATTLVGNCYESMFFGCSKLNYIKALFTTTPSVSYTSNWVGNVASTGTFVKNIAATWTTTGVHGVPTGWTIDYTETPIVPTTSFTTTNYVTFESKEDGSKITINPSSYQTFYISKNHQDWAVFDSVFFNHLSNGDKLYVCGTLAGQNTSNDYTNFTVIGKVSSSGECSSLWNYEDPSNSLKTACGYGMFSGSTGLLSAPNIPQSLSGGGGTPSYTIATAPGASYGFSANSNNFYESQNKGMHNSAAVTRVTFTLPSAVIVSISYINHGENNYDYGLIGKPDVALSTTNTVDSNVMLNLYGKSSTSVKTFSFELESGTHFVDFKFRKDGSSSTGNDSLQFKIDSMVEPLFAMSACTYMFAGCTSLTTPPQLPATALAETCYSYMFKGCTSLTTAPELPAETLVSGCYNYMFDGCSSLNYIKALFITEPSTTYTNTWVNGVSATGTFVKNPSATWTTTGVNGVPDGWTIQTASN